MDKILAAILQIVQMEENLNRDKDIVKEMNEFLQWNDGKVKEHCAIVGGLEGNIGHLRSSTFKKFQLTKENILSKSQR